MPKRRVVYAIFACFLLAGFGLIVGGVLAWQDGHSGEPGVAHVDRCAPHGSRSGPSCYAHWTYNGEVASGYVEGGNTSQVGKDVSVRMHGTSHVTETSDVVPIGLWLLGLFVIGVFAMLLVVYRRRGRMA